MIIGFPSHSFINFSLCAQIGNSFPFITCERVTAWCCISSHDHLDVRTIATQLQEVIYAALSNEQHKICDRVT